REFFFYVICNNFSFAVSKCQKSKIMRKFNLTVLLLLFASTAFCQLAAIRVVKEGNGNPILFLPGSTNSGSVWRETIENLEVESESHLISYAGFNGIEPIDTPWYSTIKAELLLYIEK